MDASRPTRTSGRAAFTARASSIASRIIGPVTMEIPTHRASSSCSMIRSRNRGSTVESTISTVKPRCSAIGASASNARGGAASMLLYEGKNSKTLVLLLFNDHHRKLRRRAPQDLSANLFELSCKSGKHRINSQPQVHRSNCFLKAIKSQITSTRREGFADSVFLPKLNDTLRYHAFAVGNVYVKRRIDYHDHSAGGE